MKTDTFKGKYYCTSFCNFAHRLQDGMPVNHECYVLVPRLLQAEARGDTVEGPMRTRRISRGVKIKFVEVDQ